MIDEKEKELQLLKEKYGVVYTLKVPANDDETEFVSVFLKKPDRTIYSIVSKLASGNDPFRAIEAALKNLYIGGDKLDLILQNDISFMSCESAIVEILKKKEASLKKN